MAFQTGDTISIANFRGIIFPYAGSSAPTGFLLCDGAAVSRVTYAGLFAVIGTTYGAGDGSTTFNVPDLRGRFAIGAGTGGRVYTLAGTAVSSNQITVPSNRELYSGQLVTYAGTGITGLSAGDYYVIRIDSTHIKLASSRANAVAATPVPITISGTPSGASLSTALTVASLGEYGGEESHTSNVDEMPSHSHNPTDSTGVGGSVRITTYSATDDNSRTYVDNSDGSYISKTGGSSPHNNLPPFAGVNFIIKT